MNEWTEDRVALLSKLWNTDGRTASECAKVLEITRNSVIGKVHRLKFAKRRSTVSNKNSVGWSASAREAARVKRAANERVRRAALAMPKPVFRSGRMVAPIAPVPRETDERLVAKWLAQHGGPRKFEPAATGDPSMLVLWLRERGYQTSYSRAGGGIVKVVTPDGRKKSLSLKALTELSDSLRVAEGLAPMAVKNSFMLVNEAFTSAGEHTA